MRGMQLMARVALGALLAGVAALVCACSGGVQGMAGDVFVSRGPAYTVQARDLPLRTAGQVLASVSPDTSLFGVTVPAWLAVYGGQNAEQPLAVVAHASVPIGHYWEAVSPLPFSTSAGVAVLGDMELGACTFVAGEARNPFAGLTPADATGAPRQWLVRHMARRFAGDQEKLILEYREILPAEYANLDDLEVRGTYLRAFNKRAEAAFVVAGPGQMGVHNAPLGLAYPQGLARRFLDKRFFGGIGRYEPFPR